VRNLTHLRLRSLSVITALAGAAATASASCPDWRPPNVPTIEEARRSSLCDGTRYEARVRELQRSTPERDAELAAAKGDFRLLGSATPFSWDGHICMVPYRSEHTVSCSLMPAHHRQTRDRLLYFDAYENRMDPNPESDAPPVQCATVLGALLADYRGKYNRTLVGHPDYPHKDICVSRQVTGDETAQNAAVTPPATAAPAPTTKLSRISDLPTAARFGDIEAVKRLLAASAPRDTIDDFGLSALEWAVIRRFPDVQGLLLKNSGADGQPYCRALRYSVGLKRTDHIGSLVLLCAREPGEAARNDRHVLINRAARVGDIGFLRVMHHEGVALTEPAPRRSDLSAASDETWVDEVAWGGTADVRILDEQIGRNGEPEAACPLHSAARTGQYAIVRYLLDVGVRADAVCKMEGVPPRLPLHSGIAGGHVPIIELLLASGGSIRPIDTGLLPPMPLSRHLDHVSGLLAPPLHYALLFRREDVLRSLIAHGADINGRDSLGYPPLFSAAMLSSGLDLWPVTLDMVLRLGADPNARSAEPQEHLLAASHPNLNLRLPASSGRTALMHVIALSRMEAPNWRSFGTIPPRPPPDWPASVSLSAISKVKMLLAAGADPRIADSLGLTPLHYVAQTDLGVEIAVLLLDAGAHVSARDKTGATPLDHARRLSLERMTSLLERYGGRPVDKAR